jgi:hypothetical protein
MSRITSSCLIYSLHLWLHPPFCILRPFWRNSFLSSLFVLFLLSLKSTVRICVRVHVRLLFWKISVSFVISVSVFRDYVLVLQMFRRALQISASLKRKPESLYNSYMTVSESSCRRACIWFHDHVWRLTITATVVMGHPLWREDGSLFHWRSQCSSAVATNTLQTHASHIMHNYTHTLVHESVRSGLEFSLCFIFLRFCCNVSLVKWAAA